MSGNLPYFLGEIGVTVGPMKKPIWPLLVVLVACHDQSPAPIDPVGTYDLRTVNGHALPFTVNVNDSSYVTYRAGAIEIAAGGRYVEERDEIAVSGHYVTFPVGSFSATWSETAGTFTLTGYASASLTADGLQLTTVAHDTTRVYTKR